MKIIYGEKYRTGYKGGALQYLDEWETAAIKYNRLAEPGEEISNELLIQILGMKFKAINDTEAIFEQAKDNTDTFDELVNSLRIKLA